MLITELGYFALTLALVLAILQAVLPTLGVWFGQIQWQRLAPSLAVAGLFAMLVAFFGLMAGFLFNDFTLSYVATHSNTLLPWYYKLSATWGGHEGSLLLWMTIMAVWCGAVAYFSHGLPLDIRARVLAILGMVQTMMLLMLIFTSSPFERTLPVIPVDGADLNPLLQDPGLIFHPPMLYMGYVGLSVPFAFCVAALWAGRLDAVWTRWSRPWTMVSWAFLTLGIALGSWWAYYELGWGGWWFWDPVENASLMPWLAATALLHSLATTEKRGVFKAWTMMLAIFAFALSLLGTFLVRSGVITSVHSFAADPTRGTAILLILATVIGGGLTLFALRGWRLTTESHYELVSKESALVVNNILLLIATLVVLLGTLYPIIADAFSLGQVSVGVPYFNALFVPLTWILLAVMGIGANLRWKKDRRGWLRPTLAIGVSALVLGIIVLYVMMNLTGVQALTGQKQLAIVTTAGLVFWVLGFMFMDLKDKTHHATGLVDGFKKLGVSYIAMQVAHLGVLIAALGVVGVSYLHTEKDVAMQVGQAVSVQGYEFYLQDFDTVHASNYDATIATITVKKDDKLITTLYPEKRQYVVSMRPMTEVGLKASLWQDIYVALAEPLDAQAEQWVVRVYIKPMIRWLWLGAAIMALGGFMAVMDRRYRLKVRPVQAPKVTSVQTLDVKSSDSAPAS